MLPSDLTALRDNVCDPVARFQLAGCVQQLRWKESRVFTVPQGCLITAWKQESFARDKEKTNTEGAWGPSCSGWGFWRAHLISTCAQCFLTFQQWDRVQSYKDVLLVLWDESKYRSLSPVWERNCLSCNKLTLYETVHNYTLKVFFSCMCYRCSDNNKICLLCKRLKFFASIMFWMGTQSLQINFYI